METIHGQNLQMLANEHCVVGENPLWDDVRQLLYWTDIPSGRLYCWDHHARKHVEIYRDEPVGGFTLQEDGSLLLFRVNNIAHRRLDGMVHVLRSDIDAKMDRFNDVIADPEGRVFAGTIAKNEQGGLFLLQMDGSIQLLFRGSGCSNGMGFSPELKQFYWTCTTRRRIYRYAYDRQTGTLSDETILVQVPPGEGVPDGMTIDRDGTIWSARWDGGGVYHYSPDGTLLGKLDMPVPKVSSATFGGEGFHTLFMTTAGGKGPQAKDDSQNGALFSVLLPQSGRKAFRSKVRTG